MALLTKGITVEEGSVKSLLFSGKEVIVGPHID